MYRKQNKVKIWSWHSSMFSCRDGRNRKKKKLSMLSVILEYEQLSLLWGLWTETHQERGDTLPPCHRHWATARPWGLKLEVGSRVRIGCTAECWWLHLVDVHSIYQRSWDPAQQKWRWHSAVQRWAQWQMYALAQQTPEGMAASMATLSSRNTMSAVSVNHRDNFPFSRSHIWKNETNNNEKPS